MAEPTLEEAIGSFRTNLDALDGDARRRLRRAYRRAWRSILDELEALQAKIRTAPTIPIVRGDGTLTQGLPPSWLFQEQRYLSLQAQARNLVDGMTSELIDSTLAARASSYERGVQDARRAVSTFVPEFDPGTWASVPRGAVTGFLGASAAGPLASLFSTFQLRSGAVADSFIRETLAAGLVQGRSLFRVAGDLEAGLSSITLSRALTISRTETLRAYREGSFAAYNANAKLVRSWVWRAAVENAERPPCAACFARHGSEHPITERMETHPNCRCVMIPQRNAIGGLRPSGPGSRIEPLGRAAFDRLPADVQRRILGPTRLGMYRNGEIAFSDFAGVRTSAAWGANRAAVAPLRELRAVAGETRTIRRAAEDRIARDLSFEPSISGVLQGIEGEVEGAELAGFAFRVKSFESTARKVAGDIRESELPLSPEAAAGGLRDTVRFTYHLPTASYAESTIVIRERLLASGYEPFKWSPSWEGTGYKGLNTAWRDPGGNVFELQFHTARSLQVKETISHPLYEAQRILAKTDPEWSRLQRAIDEAWASVEIPRAIRRVYFGS